MARLGARYSTPFPDGIPGPYVKARVTRGDDSTAFRELPALLDTGSDITLIPRGTIDALDLQLVEDDLELHDGTGAVTHNAALYRADVQIVGLPAQTVGITSTDAAVIFLGLDILNDYLAHFDGPRQAFTLD